MRKNKAVGCTQEVKFGEMGGKLPLGTETWTKGSLTEYSVGSSGEIKLYPLSRAFSFSLVNVHFSFSVLFRSLNCANCNFQLVSRVRAEVSIHRAGFGSLNKTETENLQDV